MPRRKGNTPPTSRPPPTKHRGRPLSADTPLSPREVLFVAEYLVDFDAQRAYAAVGYQGGKNIRIHACRLLGKPHVQCAVQRGIAKRVERTEITQDRVLTELGRIAFVNTKDFFDEHGDAKHPKDLTADQGAALAGFEVLIKNAKAGDGITDTIHKFKLWDKPKTLELLCRHLGMLNDKLDLTARLKVVNETATDEELLARLEVLLAKAKKVAA